MSDAYYHCGLTIEVDASAPRVTIDGHDDEIPRERLSDQFAVSDSPSTKAEKALQYAKRFIDQSPEFQRRKGTRSPPLVTLQAGWRGAADLCGRGPGGW